MGRITAPFGIKGWLKIHPYTASPENLLAYAEWWMEDGGVWRQRRVERAEVHGQSVAAKLDGCADRDLAEHYRGRDIAVPREALPEAAANEFYWADLVGLRVVNTQGEELGTIFRVFETGANDVLVVNGERERLIPFIEQVVKQVDTAKGLIRVDWGADF